MTNKEALEDIKGWVEYITRLDYVDPIVRGEVKDLLFNAYHKTTPEFQKIEDALEVLNILKKYCTNDGWSNGYSIAFYNMEETEIQKIEKWFKEK